MLIGLIIIIFYFFSPVLFLTDDELTQVLTVFGSVLITFGSIALASISRRRGRVGYREKDQINRKVFKTTIFFYLAYLTINVMLFIAKVYGLPFGPFIGFLVFEQILLSFVNGRFLTELSET